MTLFNEAEVTKDNQVKEPVLEEMIYKRRKKKYTDGKSFDHLPVEVIEYKLEDEECTCPQSLMAFVMDKKYSQALPLYRQEKQWKYGLVLCHETKY